MKTLILFRHGKSSWDDPSLDDFDRPLARRGRKAADVMGRRMAERGWLPDLVVCSAAKRTIQTLERLREAWPSPVETRIEGGLYMADERLLLNRVQRLDNASSTVLLLGHNPGLQGLAVLLVGGGETELRRRLGEKFPTAALAVIALPVESWREVRVGSGTLEAFVRPKTVAAPSGG